MKDGRKKLDRSISEALAASNLRRRKEVRKYLSENVNKIKELQYESAFGYCPPRPWYDVESEEPLSDEEE